MPPQARGAQAGAPPTLSDGVVVLRPPTLDDVDAITEACRDDEVVRWTTVPVPYDRSDAIDWVSGHQDDWWATPTWAISTLPDLDSNRTLVHGLRLNHPASPVAVAIRDETQEQQLQSLESATLLFPFRDAVELVAEQLCQRIHTQESGI